MTRGVGLLIDRLIRSWLKETPLGSEIMAEVGMSIDQAVDAVFELLNAGHLKITNPSPDRFSLAPCIPPEPPATPLIRGH